MGSLSVWHVVIVLVLLAFGSRMLRGKSSSRLANYVVKEWVVSDRPDAEGILVRIVGRQGGLISYLLSLIGVDATIRLTADVRRITFESGSWSGFMRTVIPVSHLCACTNGYEKPWKTAAVIGGAGVAIAGTVSGWLLALLLLLLFLTAAVVYYKLGKQTILGLEDVGGNLYQIGFKRSVIEGRHIDEADAAGVVSIIEMLIEHGADPHRRTDAFVPPIPTRSAQDPVGTTTDQFDTALGQGLVIAKNAASDVVQRTKATIQEAQKRALDVAHDLQREHQRSQPAAGSTEINATAAVQRTTTSARKCPGCGAAASPTDVFCGECGYKLAPTTN